MKNDKKGQLSLGNAPTIVLIVGLAFLIMATIAFIGEKYGNAMPSDRNGHITNETLTSVDSVGEYLSVSTACNLESLSIDTDGVTNASGGLATIGMIIPATNYTLDSDGRFWFSGVDAGSFNNTNMNVSYTYSYAGAGCNVTRDLQTEIGNNTSIAGIVLTISLVGIVLTVLMSVFMGIRGRGRV